MFKRAVFYKLKLVIKSQTDRQITQNKPEKLECSTTMIS